MEPRWGLGRAACFRAASVRTPGVSLNLGNNQNTNSLGDNLGEDRQALSDCEDPASSWRYRTAREETWKKSQKLTQNPHYAQLRAEVDELKENFGHLVRLFRDSLYRESSEQNLHVGKICTDKLIQKDGAEESLTRGEHNRMDVTQHKQEQFEQQKQQRQEEEETSKEETSKQKRPKPHNNNSLGTQQINSLGREDHDQQPSLYQIMIDTGAELSVAPKSFADHIQLSSEKLDIELRGANGNQISIYGTRRVELVTIGFNFPTCFVIADVEKPLLSLRSLLENNLSLHLSSSQGHQLVNSEGEKIQLQQLGQQIFLSACPMELELTSSMIGILQNESLMPEDKLEAPRATVELRKHREMPKEGGATSSFTLENLGHLKQHSNKTAIGQQQALPKPAKKEKKKQLGQWAASKLRPWAKTRINNEIQLALLNPNSLEKTQHKKSASGLC